MRALALAAVFLLAACADDARVESSSTDGVTVMYPEGSHDRAGELATEECQKYGNRAALRTTHTTSNERYGIYDCRV